MERIFNITPEEADFLDRAAIAYMSNSTAGSYSLESGAEKAYNRAEALLRERRKRYEIVTPERSQDIARRIVKEDIPKRYTFVEALYERARLKNSFITKHEIEEIAIEHNLTPDDVQYVFEHGAKREGYEFIANIEENGFRIKELRK